MAAPKPYLKKILSTLAADKRNNVLIVSHRKCDVVMDWFQGLNVAMVAEGGFFYRMKQDSEWIAKGATTDRSWMEVVQPIMQYFKERTPGSFIEVKDSTLSWHYCDTDVEFGNMQARDMKIHLEDVLSNLPLDVIQGSKVVEVRVQGISKGTVLEEFFQRLSASDPTKSLDFVLCVGDDVSDESMFRAINASQTESTSIYTCRIGTSRSQATYYLETITEFRRLLRTLATLSRDHFA